jgi:STE24 endopeptidase
LSDTLIAGDTPPELAYDVAVELGHVVHRDLLSIALIEGGIVILFSALAVVLADRITFRRDDDPLSRLAIVAALLAVVYIAAVPARNAALRSYDFSADRYAIALTGDPADAVRALVRDSDQRMEEVCPELSAVLFLYTSPGTGARVAAINHVPSGCP